MGASLKGRFIHLCIAADRAPNFSFVILVMHTSRVCQKTCYDFHSGHQNIVSSMNARSKMAGPCMEAEVFLHVALVSGTDFPFTLNSQNMSVHSSIYGYSRKTFDGLKHIHVNGDVMLCCSRTHACSPCKKVCNHDGPTVRISNCY
jgi:hypothetical protein